MVETVETAEILGHKIPFIINPTHISPTHIVNPTHKGLSALHLPGLHGCI